MEKNLFEPIAVIGYGCVYPPDGFWDVIISGKSGIGVVPEERWAWEYYYQPISSVAIDSVKSKNGHTFSAAGMANLTPKSENNKQNNLNSISKSEEYIFLVGADTWIELTHKINDVLDQREMIYDLEKYVEDANYRMALMYKTEEEFMRKLKMVN